MLKVKMSGSVLSPLLFCSAVSLIFIKLFTFSIFFRWRGQNKKRKPQGMKNRNRKRKNPRSSKTNSKWGKLVKNEKHKRNWAELDADVLSIIFMKVGAIDLLMHAQFVCKPWRDVSFNPCIWKVADFTTLEEDCMVDLDLEKMTIEAVDRSKGQMQDLSIKCFGSDKLLSYVADRTSILKRLRVFTAYYDSRLISAYTDEGLIDMIKRQPQLQELDISFAVYSIEIFKKIGKACPNLRCFRFNQIGEGGDDLVEDDGDAYDIANNMPELRVLQLVGNPLTNKGLVEILDKCKHLESLDIRCCFAVNVNDEIKAKAKRLKEFRLPLDSTDDYEFVAKFEYNMNDPDFDYNDDSDDTDDDYDPMAYMEELEELGYYLNNP